MLDLFREILVNMHLGTPNEWSKFQGFVLIVLAIDVNIYFLSWLNTDGGKTLPLADSPSSLYSILFPRTRYDLKRAIRIFFFIAVIFPPLMIAFVRP